MTSADVIPFEHLRPLLLRIAGQWGPLAQARVRLPGEGGVAGRRGEGSLDDQALLLDGGDVEVSHRPGRGWQLLARIDDLGEARREVERFNDQQRLRRRFAEEVTVPSAPPSSSR